MQFHYRSLLQRPSFIIPVSYLQYQLTQSIPIYCCLATLVSHAFILGLSLYFPTMCEVVYNFVLSRSESRWLTQLPSGLLIPVVLLDLSFYLYCFLYSRFTTGSQRIVCRRIDKLRCSYCQHQCIVIHGLNLFAETHYLFKFDVPWNVFWWWVVLSGFDVRMFVHNNERVGCSAYSGSFVGVQCRCELVVCSHVC
jgi:hypothetical protein